jgi:hypothetical protein
MRYAAVKRNNIRRKNFFLKLLTAFWYLIYFSHAFKLENV